MEEQLNTNSSVFKGLVRSFNPVPYKSFLTPLQQTTHENIMANGYIIWILMSNFSICHNVINFIQ